MTPAEIRHQIASYADQTQAPTPAEWREREAAIMQAVHELWVAEDTDDGSVALNECLNVLGELLESLPTAETPAPGQLKPTRELELGDQIQISDQSCTVVEVKSIGMGWTRIGVRGGFVGSIDRRSDLMVNTIITTPGTSRIDD